MIQSINFKYCAFITLAINRLYLNKSTRHYTIIIHNQPCHAFYCILNNIAISNYDNFFNLGNIFLTFVLTWYWLRKKACRVNNVQIRSVLNLTTSVCFIYLQQVAKMSTTNKSSYIGSLFHIDETDDTFAICKLCHCHLKRGKST